MKRQVIIALTWCLSIGVFSINPTIIKGQIAGGVPAKVSISTRDDSPHPGFMKETSVDASGAFQTLIHAKNTFLINVHVSMNDEVYYRSFILDPGETYQIELTQKPNTDKPQLYITGKNSEGNDLYNTLSHVDFAQQSYRKYRKEPTLQSFKDKIKIDVEQEKQALKQLLDQKKISKSFYQLACDDRDCYFNMTAFQKPKSELYNLEDIEKLSPELKNYWSELCKSLLAHPSWKRSLYWDNCVEALTEHYIYNVEKKNINDMRALHKNGSYNSYFLSIAKKHLAPSEYELFAPLYLYGVCIQKRFEKELIDITQQYNKEFPKTQYSYILDSYINEVEVYHAQKTLKNDEIKIIENYSSIDDFQSCIALFKGKRLFIDVWATWCGPCKSQFAHNPALKKVLKENGYETLYISIDTDEDDLKWKEMMQYYQLEGSHIRVNKKMDADLRTVFGSTTIMIPWYIIVDEDGKIVRLKASKPSKLSELEKELDLGS